MAQSKGLGCSGDNAGGNRLRDDRVLRKVGARCVFTLAIIGLSLLTSGCALGIPYSGFAAISPEQGFHSMSEQMDVPVIDSLQPELVWSAFPGEDQRCLLCEKQSFVDVDMAKVANVTYHLRIWHAPNLAPDQIAYDRPGLSEESHRVEQPLEPDSIYFWSVRARFQYEGETRLTEWSISNLPFYRLPFPQLGPDGTGTESARRVAQRTGTLPPRNYYRFQTPASATP